jgi:hypothetical protein
MTRELQSGPGLGPGPGTKILFLPGPGPKFCFFTGTGPGPKFCFLPGRDRDRNFVFYRDGTGTKFTKWSRKFFIKY